MLVPLKDYSKTGSCIEPKYGVVRLCIRDLQKGKNKIAVIQKINIASFNQKTFQPVLYDHIQKLFVFLPKEKIRDDAVSDGIRFA